MRPPRKRLIAAALILIVSAAVLLIGGGILLSSKLTKAVEEKLERIDATIGSLSINLFTRSIHIKDFAWQKVEVNDIEVRGVRIVTLLRDKRLSIRRIILEGGSVSIDNHFKVSDSTASDSIPVTSIDVDRVSINNIAVQIAKDSSTEYSATVGFVLHQIALDSPMAWRKLSAYKFKNVESFVKDLKIENWGSLYSLSAKEARFDKERMKLHIDSLALLPRVSKSDWGKTVNSQVTRTVAIVESIDAEGVKMAIHLDDTIIMASSVAIHGPSLQVYKDKRFPFKRKDKYPLPMESFWAMGLGVEADTVRIHDGRITYEEFPYRGFGVARITFDGVETTISSVNNRQFKNMDYCTIEASARVMQTGKIKATFKVPLQKNKKYSVEGTVRDLPLTELNPLLNDIVFIQIYSGRVDRMKFAFEYDDLASQGKLQLDYEDLKILSLNSEKEGDVNTFKTLLANIAVKNDETLTGNIAVARNQKKAVFNLWTISMVDGMVDALLPRKKKKK